MEIQILDISDEDSIFRSLTSLRHHWFEPQDLIYKDVPLFLESYNNELNTLEATNIVIGDGGLCNMIRRDGLK